MAGWMNGSCIQPPTMRQICWVLGCGFFGVDVEVGLGLVNGHGIRTGDWDSDGIGIGSVGGLGRMCCNRRYL